MIKLSPSSINLFLECPRCFYLQIVKGIKRPETIFPSLPNGMDKILKEHFDRFMERNELPPEIKEKCAGYKLFKNKPLLDLWRNNKKGIEFLDPNSNILLHGAVDNILVKGDKLVILDFKTRGCPVKEDTHEYYQVQMDLYNLLLRKNNYSTEDYTYLLFYYPKEVLSSGEIIFNSELVKMKTNVKNGEKVFNDAVKCITSDSIPEEKCEWCEGK